MMAPPRFQCLNAVRQVSRQAPNLRVAFSTSRIAQADAPPPRPSATSDLLSAGNGPSSPSIPFRYARPETVFTNPIQQPQSTRSSHEHLQRVIAKQRMRQDTRLNNPAYASVGDTTAYNKASALTKQITRRFKPGDVYAPHDLSEVEMAKWKKRDKPQHDVFDVLDFNPLDHYRNFSVMSEYMTPMGRIFHSSETGLRPVNQRRIAKAIRRSIGMGLMPSVHRHPETFYIQKSQRGQVMTPARPATGAPPIY